uniref:HNH endonuclease n=1 Tax=Pithovirus LCPAC201 TaxID=2506591 RepID=A0A481Z6C0_9VIRU|nr:MAG: HNH endonuclease [Pithovirus LCPAC201]
MVDYNLVKLIIHPEWSQAWQNISGDPSRKTSQSKSVVQRLPRGLVPSSLIARDTAGNQIRFALTPEKNLDQITDQMAVILTDQDNTQTEGVILAIRKNEVILHGDGKYIRIFQPKSIISVKHVELHPWISLLGIQSPNYNILLQYILDSLSWEIHYSMTLLRKKEINISVRAAIVNNSYTSFLSKNIILMAGKMAHPPKNSHRFESNLPMASLAVKSDNPPGKSYSEDLIKVMEFEGVLRPGKMYMNTDKVYQTGYLKLYRHHFGRVQTEIIYRFDSPDQMPAGEVLVYNGDQEDFIGTSFMTESNKGQLVDLLMGQSSLQVISTIDLGKTVMINLPEGEFRADEIALTAQFTNPRQEPVPVLLIYHAPRRIVKSNPKYRHRVGHTYEWLVNYQPNTDKQMVTINITQIAEKPKTRRTEKVQLTSPRPLTSLSPRIDPPLSMITIPEPTPARSFVPLEGTTTRPNPSPIHNLSPVTTNRPNPTINTVGLRPSLRGGVLSKNFEELPSAQNNISPRTQSNQTSLQSVTILKPNKKFSIN